MKTLVLLAFSVAAYAQPYILGVQYTNVDPSPTCTIRSILVSNEANGKLWQCQSGTYMDISGGGGGGGTVTSVALSTNLGTVTGSPVTTSGTLTNTVSAAQVVSLFSTCSGVQYLGADGACHAPGSGTVTSVSGANGLTGAVTTSGNISGVNAAADGSTKGVSAFTASDFDASAGVISLDYTNGQKATGSQPGFLSSTDWTTFNGKGSGTVTSVATTAPITGGTITGTGTIACATCTVTIASGAKALATTLIASGACSSAQTDTATGTLTTDTIILTFAADPTGTTGYAPSTSGMLSILHYPTMDTVNIKVCNNTLASITPGAVTLNWKVVRP